MKLYFWKLTPINGEEPIEGVLNHCTDVFLEDIIPDHVSTVDRSLWEIQDWIDEYHNGTYEFEYTEFEMSYEDAVDLFIKQSEEEEKQRSKEAR